jgi:hypothetical protein
MADDKADALREELRLVEEELAELRPQVAEARRRIGDRSDSPTDSAELAAELTAVEEQEAVVRLLERRAEGFRERLGEQS